MRFFSQNIFKTFNIFSGIKSSGKAAYFLAIFPYIMMVLIFVRAITLPGAANGIIYFLTPQWDQLLNVKVLVSRCSLVFQT